MDSSLKRELGKHWNEILRLKDRMDAIIAGAGGGITQLTGNVTAGPGSGSQVTTIENDAVTYARLQNVAANSYLGRAAGSSGDVGEVALAASELAGRGSSGDLAAIALGTNLTMSGTTLNATGTGGGSGFGTVPTSGWTVRNGILWNDYIAPVSLGLWIIDNASLNWRLLTQSLSGASEYTVIATVLGDIAGGAGNSTTFGLYVYDGTKAIGLEVLSQTAGSGGKYRLRVQRLTNLNTDGGTQHGPTISIVGYPATLKIVQDATNRTFYYYENGAFTQFYQEAAGAYLTETDVGVGGVSAIGSVSAGVGVELLQWSLT